MVDLDKVRASNRQIATALPPGLVAVYVGATSGIGEIAMKAFVKHSVRPRVYFVGRSQTSADRITAELNALNSEGEYIFIQADISLLAGVDKVCQQIRARETAVNLLVQSQGSIDTNTSRLSPIFNSMASHCAIY
jgi:short-subunit dehydrogenase